MKNMYFMIFIAFMMSGCAGVSIRSFSISFPCPGQALLIPCAEVSGDDKGNHSDNEKNDPS